MKDPNRHGSSLDPKDIRSRLEPYDEFIVLKALKDVRLKSKTICGVSKRYKIPVRTLRRYLDKYRDADLRDDSFSLHLTEGRNVFNKGLEEEFILYYLDSLGSFRRLRVYEVCNLAYEFAKSKQIRVPKCWERGKCAKRKWYRFFVQRHPSLIARLLGIRNLACAPTMHRDSIAVFFKEFELSILENKFARWDVYYVCRLNMAIVSDCDKENLENQDSHPAQMVTLVATISSNTKVLPPFCTLLSKNCQNAPHNSTKDDLFLNYLRHFVKYSNCSLDKPSLLLMPWDSFYLSLDTDELMKKHNITLLKFPEDYPRSLRPLDSTFQRLKNRLDDEMKYRTLCLKSGEVNFRRVFEIIGDVYSDELTYDNLVESCEVSVDFTEGK